MLNTKFPHLMSALLAILVMTTSACVGGLVGDKKEKLAYFESLERETLARLVK